MPAARGPGRDSVTTRSTALCSSLPYGPPQGRQAPEPTPAAKANQPAPEACRTSPVVRPPAGRQLLSHEAPSSETRRTSDGRAKLRLRSVPIHCGNINKSPTARAPNKRKAVHGECQATRVRESPDQFLRVHVLALG